MLAQTFEKEINTNQCYECGCEMVISDTITGDMICCNCGLVIQAGLVNQSIEYHESNVNGTNIRSITDNIERFTIFDKGLSTLIDRIDRDINGNLLTATKKAEANRLRKWQNHSYLRSSFEKSIVNAMIELHRITACFGIGQSIKETAALFIRKITARKLCHGRSIECMVTASLFIACRISNLFLTIDDFVNHSVIKKRELSHSIRTILSELNIRLPELKPTYHISRLGFSLSVSMGTQNMAIKILEKANKLGLTVGRDPFCLAGTALYLAGLKMGEKRTQREIARVAHITEITIRNRSNELIKKLHISLNLT